MKHTAASKAFFKLRDSFQASGVRMPVSLKTATALQIAGDNFVNYVGEASNTFKASCHNHKGEIFLWLRKSQQS
jgi:hypothetical protein